MSILIKADNMTVDFPIYGTRSFKNTVITGMTGGKIRMMEKNAIVRALDSLSFEFKEHERVGLWGHNGSGKTTLLRVLSGIYKPSSGSIEIKGSIASLLSISLGMDNGATGLENIYLRAAMIGLTRSEVNERLDEIIEFTELGDFIHLPMKTYSSGMQMRLSFAVSTAIEANIILMDEWLSVGDKHFADKAKARLDQMLSKSKLLVIASHNMDMLKSNCTRILHLDHGCINEHF